jgi:hypothetical protein
VRGDGGGCTPAPPCEAVRLAEGGLLLALACLRGLTALARLISVIARPGADANTGNEGKHPRPRERRKTPPGRVIGRDSHRVSS